MSPQTERQDVSHVTGFLRFHCVLVAFLAFFWLLREAESLGLKRNMPMWVVDAIPPALSETCKPDSKRYTTLVTIQRAFQNIGHSAQQLNAAIAKVRTFDLSSDNGDYVLLGSDDKGIVDFVRIAFQLFGYRVQSVFYLYFTLLFVSLVLLMLAYGDSPRTVAAATSILVMTTLIMPMIAYYGQLTSLLALRVFPVLTLLACFHCLLFVLRGEWSWRGFAGFLAQLALITFVVHIRSTTVWQFVVILLAIFSSIAVAFWKKRTRSDATTSLQAISCAAAALFGLMAGYLGLCLYRSTAFPEEYKRGEQIMTRVTWHNIFSGLAFHPRLARDFQIQLDDASIIRATGKYLVAQGRDADWEAMGGKSPRFTGMRWTPYDRAVRDLLIDTFCRRPWDCIVAMAYYKPVALVKNLAWLYGVRRSPSSLDLLTSPTVGNIVKSQVIQATERLDAQGLRQGPWTPMALVMMGLFAFPIRLVPESRHVGFAVLFLLFGSLIPVLVGYPVPHTIAEIGIMAGVTFHFLLITQFLHRRQ